MLGGCDAVEFIQRGLGGCHAFQQFLAWQSAVRSYGQGSFHQPPKAGAVPCPFGQEPEVVGRLSIGRIERQGYLKLVARLLIIANAT